MYGIPLNKQQRREGCLMMTIIGTILLIGAILLLMLNSCAIQTHTRRTYHIKKECSEDKSLKFIYDSTVWKVVPMTKEDSAILQNY